MLTQEEKGAITARRFKSNGETRHCVKTQTTLRGRACKACTKNARTARSTGNRHKPTKQGTAEKKQTTLRGRAGKACTNKTRTVQSTGNRHKLTKQGTAERSKQPCAAGPVRPARATLALRKALAIGTNRKSKALRKDANNLARQGL